MISNFFEIFLLSIVQGISEFLPISSAAHLILVSNIYEFKNQSLLIDISLHLGSLLAILFYFRKDIFDFRKNLNLFYKIAISTMPLVVVGYFLYSTEIIYQLRNIKVIAWSTLFFGILIYIADKNIFLKKIETDFNIKSALIIGFFQVIALIPGVSRAGITITAGRILGFNRVDSTKISFSISEFFRVVFRLAFIRIFAFITIITITIFVLEQSHVDFLFTSAIIDFNFRICVGFRIAYKCLFATETGN